MPVVRPQDTRGKPRKGLQIHLNITAPRGTPWRHRAGQNDSSARPRVKAAGVVIDGAAVTPRHVIGLAAQRETPIIARIAIGDGSAIAGLGELTSPIPRIK
jgi:hypothetical protein